MPKGSFGGSDVAKRALFLDRDGVINVDHGYVYRPENFEFVEGIFSLCEAAQRLDYLLVVVTNQAGIARGYYSEAEFFELMGWVDRQFIQRGITLSAVYHCPYHPIHGIGPYKRESEDRKPRPGMLLRAALDLNLDLGNSVMIGDQLTDIEAAALAGVGLKLQLSAEGQVVLNSDFKPDRVIHRLSEAVPLIRANARSGRG